MTLFKLVLPGVVSSVLPKYYLSVYIEHMLIYY